MIYNRYCGLAILPLLMVINGYCGIAMILLLIVNNGYRGIAVLLFQVVNNGPSLISRLSMNISWPYYVINGQPLINLLQPKFIDNSSNVCRWNFAASNEGNIDIVVSISLCLIKTSQFLINTFLLLIKTALSLIKTFLLLI